MIFRTPELDRLSAINDSHFVSLSELKPLDRDPSTAWFAHRSVPVDAIFFGFDWC